MNIQVLLVTALLGIFSGCSAQEEVIHKGDHILVCRGVADMGIIFDVSVSIPVGDFKTVKDRLASFLQQFTISSRHARIGLIPFENEIHPNNGFLLDTYNSTAQVVNHLNKLPHIGYKLARTRALTETWKALRYVKDTMLTPATKRDGVPQICVVMTDGNSQQTQKTKEEAAKLRATGVDVYAVGYGRDITMEELENIAGSLDRVRLAKNLVDLEGIMKLLSKRVCEKIPLVRDPPCIERDVNVVFSRPELGERLSRKVLRFVENMSSMPKFSSGYRWGVVSGVCPMDAGFGLTARVTQQIPKYFPKFHFNQLISSLLRVGYADTQNEARCNVAILVVNEASLADLQTNVVNIRRLGIEEVYVWDMSGSGVTVAGAQVITARVGTDPRLAARVISRLITTE